MRSNGNHLPAPKNQTLRREFFIRSADKKNICGDLTDPILTFYVSPLVQYAMNYECDFSKNGSNHKISTPKWTHLKKQVRKAKVRLGVSNCKS